MTIAAPRRRSRFIVGGTASLAVVAFLLWGWSVSWLPPSAYLPSGPSLAPRIMPMAAYREVIETHPRPYILRLDIGPGSAVIVGVSHTKDPDDPLVGIIQSEWTSARPTVALVEGRPGAPFAALANPVKQFGEGGLVTALARASGVPIYTWEPERDRLTDAMLSMYPRERVALLTILNPYFSNLRHGKPADPDAVVERTRAKRSGWKGLEGVFASVAEIDAVWRRDFAGLPDWRDTSDQFGLPGYLAEMSDFSRDLRTANLAEAVTELASRGERVFAVCGVSHAVRIEPALTAPPPGVGHTP